MQGGGERTKDVFFACPSILTLGEGKGGGKRKKGGKGKGGGGGGGEWCIVVLVSRNVDAWPPLTTKEKGRRGGRRKGEGAV